MLQPKSGRPHVWLVSRAGFGWSFTGLLEDKKKRSCFISTHPNCYSWTVHTCDATTPRENKWGQRRKDVKNETPPCMLGWLVGGVVVVGGVAEVSGTYERKGGQWSQSCWLQSCGVSSCWSPVWTLPAAAAENCWTADHHHADRRRQDQLLYSSTLKRFRWEERYHSFIFEQETVFLA